MDESNFLTENNYQNILPYILMYGRILNIHSHMYNLI